MVAAFEERAKVFGRDLGKHAPGLGELRVQKNAAFQANDAQDI